MPGTNRLRSVAALAALLLAAGCGNNPIPSKCAGVTCQGGQTCDPATGQCVGGMPQDMAMQLIHDMAMPTDGPTMPDLNAACMNAAKLQFTNNVAMVTGDTTSGVNNTSSPNCGGTGNDLVYAFTITQAQTVDAVITPSGSSPNYDPVISIRSVCTSEMPSDEVTCNELGPGMAVTVDAVLMPGTYWVWVDGYANSAGAFTLQVTLSPPPTPPANENCTSTQALPAFANNMVSVTGDLRAAADDTAGTCGGAMGGDAVYSFTTTAAQSVTATLTADASAPNYTPVVYIRTTCDSTAATDEVTCNLGFAGDVATVQVGYLPAGTYYVWTDADGMPGGKFKLDVALGTPGPTNDSCFGPAPLTFNGNVATTAVDLTTAHNDVTSPNCFTGDGPDLVYSFTLASAQRVTALVTPDMASANFDATVSIRGTCSDANSELVCNDVGPGMPVSVVKVLQPGTYYVWVDSADAMSAGTGTLTVTLSAPPANESCAAPQMVAVPSSTMGDSSGAADDVGANIAVACDLNGTGFPGADLVYSFTAAATAMVNVTVTPDMTWDPALYVLPTTCMNDASNCTYGADVNATGMPETIMLPATAGTTYFIVVDSYNTGEGGPFTLALQ
jgi:hypothetical protein